MITAEELQNKLSHVTIGSNDCNYSLDTCKRFVPLINEINKLKKEKNAIILAHSYVSPEILVGVADFVGDSFELSKIAQETDCETIIFSSVRFMAETAKILNPDKKVFIPSYINGCSLADSITKDDVIKLREQYPNYAFVCYINTSAEVKAHCDICVTSSNVYKIIEEIPNDRVYFLPDKLMGINVEKYLSEKGIKKTFKYYHGTCYVHEAYDVSMIDFLKLKYPKAVVVAHPECKPEVVEKSDFIGSTSQMMVYVRESMHKQYIMLTECGLTSRIQLEESGKEFVGACTMCKYMKSNQLDQILLILKGNNSDLEVTLDPDILNKAKKSLLEMFKYSGK